MKTQLTDEEAIRQVILEGVKGDFCDVARVVSDRFRLDVSTSQVEEIYGKLREEMTQMKTSPGNVEPEQKQPIKIGSVGLAMQTDVSKSTPTAPAEVADSAATHAYGRDPVMAFVQSMGGFEAARNAINDLETSLKQLLK